MEINMNSQQKKFNELLFEAIDEALSSLGEPVKNYVYIRFENDFGVKKHEIPEEIEEFSKMLHRLFGVAANRLEVKSMEKLYPKIKANMEGSKINRLKWIENDVTFQSYTEKMRQNFITSSI